MSTVLQGWRLFWLLFAAITIGLGTGLPGLDFHSHDAVEQLIFRSILCVLPSLIAAFLASSLARLWPSRFTRWLLSNRRYIGLSFAAGMLWHFVLVAWYIGTFGYHLETQDISLDVAGVLLLLAMTLTSFAVFRKKLTPVGWRRLHTVGIYTLWLLPTFFYLEDFIHGHDLPDGTAVAILLSVLAIRITGQLVGRKASTRAPALNP